MSDNGQIQATQKSDLTEILLKQVTIPETRPEAIVIDGSALINVTPPQVSKIFDAYVQDDAISKLEAYEAKYQRNDVVFDVYTKDSFKSGTRCVRGWSIRVLAISKTPANWKSFLMDDRNKTGLFEFLSDKACNAETMTSLVIATKGSRAISNSCGKCLN